MNQVNQRKEKDEKRLIFRLILILFQKVIKTALWSSKYVFLVYKVVDTTKACVLCIKKATSRRGEYEAAIISPVQSKKKAHFYSHGNINLDYSVPR